MVEHIVQSHKYRTSETIATKVMCVLIYLLFCLFTTFILHWFNLSKENSEKGCQMNVTQCLIDGKTMDQYGQERTCLFRCLTHLGR